MLGAVEPAEHLLGSDLPPGAGGDRGFRVQTVLRRPTRDFEEAARIDGAGFWRIYRSIILPLSQPVIAAMSILTFVSVWNNLILPLFVLSNPKLMTIPVGLATVQGSYGQRVADIQASAILGALPLVILYLFFQRRIIEGVAGSAVKG